MGPQDKLVIIEAGKFYVNTILIGPHPIGGLGIVSNFISFSLFLTSITPYKSFSKTSLIQ